MVDASEAECQGVQTVLAAFVLFLALCDWHVPSIMPHHYIVCRILSAIRTHALYPTSAALFCWAFAHPTFGKRAHTTTASASRCSAFAYGASEDVPTRPDDDISLADVIAKFEAMGRTTERAEEILAAAITLRDSSGRDRKYALQNMATTRNVSRQEKVHGKWKIVASVR